MFKPRLRLSCGLHALVSAWNSSGYCGFLPYFKNMQGQLTKSLTVLNVCELLFFYNCTVYRAPPSKVSCARISSLVLNKHDRIFLDVRYLPRNKENHDKQIMSVIHPLQGWWAYQQTLVERWGTPETGLQPVTEHNWTNKNSHSQLWTI